MNIYVDEKIYARDSFKQFGKIILFNENNIGSILKNNNLNQESAIISRTTTFIDQSLIDRFRDLKFVATATSGFDHVDVDYLKKKDIPFFSSLGCNSMSVVEYIMIAMGFYYKKISTLKDKTIFVCGAGNVGSKLVKVLKLFNLNVLVCDPPLKDKQDGVFDYTDMNASKDCDILIFCVPLNKEEPYKTLYFLNNSFFKDLKKKPLFINTSRGSIVSSEVLLEALNSQCIQDIIVDVYEGEPKLNQHDVRLIRNSFISTPHIAGYSMESKVQATKMIYDQLYKYYKINNDHYFSDFYLEKEKDFFLNKAVLKQNDILYKLTYFFDLISVSENFRNSPLENFQKMRQKFVKRRNLVYHLNNFKDDEKKLFSNNLEMIRNICYLA